MLGCGCSWWEEPACCTATTTPTASPLSLFPTLSSVWFDRIFSCPTKNIWHPVGAAYLKEYFYHFTDRVKDGCLSPPKRELGRARRCAAAAPPLRCRHTGMQATDGAPTDEALEAAFNAELADFFVALREGESSHMLQHLGALRAMSSADGSKDAVWSELHGACATQAHEWVQQRVQHLVASFHVHLHEERGDLLAVDRALQEGGCLLREAQPEVGDLQVSHEVLTGCERQLLALLQAHVRRANRHELRMLYADFCHEGRAELRQLCLEKYKEQVAAHVVVRVGLRLSGP